jgi:phosphate uptake regulator
MITLPKEWANSIGLNKNDTVGVQAQPDGTLMLYPRGNMPAPKRSTKVIDATGTKDQALFYRQLVGAYIAGHTTILIKSAQPMPNAMMSVVNSFVQTAIGLEIIEVDDSHILIANLIEHDAIDPKKTIERMRVLIESMVYDLYEAASTGDYKALKEMEYRDKGVDRIYWLTARQHNIYQLDLSVSNKDGSLRDMISCLFIARILEGIGDLVVSISEQLISAKEKNDSHETDKNIHKAGQTIVELLTKAVKGWTVEDVVLAEQLIKESENIMKETDKCLFKPHEKDCGSTCASRMTLLSSRRIAEYCKSVADYTFNAAMK